MSRISQTMIRSSHFDDSDVDGRTEPKVVEVSKETESFIHDRCTKRLPNNDRLKARNLYALPKVPATKTSSQSCKSSR